MEFNRHAARIDAGVAAVKAWQATGGRRDKVEQWAADSLTAKGNAYLWERLRFEATEDEITRAVTGAVACGY